MKQEKPITTRQRASHALSALTRHNQVTEGGAVCSLEDQITDLLINLKHLARIRRVDFATCDRLSGEYFLAEVQREKSGVAA